MEYFILFLEGIITFISPCLLPMIPIYISYFAGGDKKQNTILNAISFVLGFTLVFVLLGAFAGVIGGLLREYNNIVNIISGIIVVLFGLNYVGVLRVPFINNNIQINTVFINKGYISSFLFGLIFSIGWTPCVGAFLGSALMLAAQSGESTKGILMLLSFSLGLGIPFIISAILIERMKNAFHFIKKNYTIINYISGGFLIIVGILMMTGYMGYFLSLLTI